MSSGPRPWRALLASIAALAAVFAFFEFTGTDLAVQDRLFDFSTGRWCVDAKDPTGRALFYNGPKYLIVAGAIALLALALGPERWREAARFDRRGLVVALLTLASVPALVGQGKASTNVFCPYDIRRYRGDVAFVKVIERFPEGERPERRGRGFPAGHASGGFALIGMLWMRRTRAWTAAVIALAIGAGWWMGGYQMAKGAHYLSHTVVTMMLAVAIALAWRCVLPAKRGIAGAH